ncbi:Sensor protein ZraS [Thalassovita gelatinovora]|uniref:histidine kinase n=1 Tax=Thalassovita gelatinovora TaxID=53501 RepID=A0A0P1FH01_THAGE|nr:HAMP domain-containing sensor histidine kinase [Thalassovita gelatinovora]QIZ81827.1 HAMP domain-containing histidine kinase [Thalassovita gelatinovora]CUH67115.1 Sensor protein ZraS [Thalassovita gelatinovora]SEP80251.1 Signal transduction histidine kinase [Thalassovita gelatinovora]
MDGFRRIPLSLRVPLLTAGLMVLLGVVASQQVLSTLGKVQDARIRELAQLQIEALSVALGPHVLRDDIWEIYDTLERAAGETKGRRMIFTVVADENGRVMAATDPVRAPLDSPISALTEGAQTAQTLSVTGDAVQVRLLAPLRYQGRTVGQIMTELDVADLISERLRAGQLLLLGNAVATGVLSILGYLAMRRMLMPIARLVRRMRETADAPEPIPESDLPRGDTEMTRLVKTYNAMTDAVEAKAETERRLAERERFVSLGRLSSSLAHEINNPLGGLLNAADTIRQYSDRPDVVRQSADILTRGLNHLRDVAQATLDQNRLDRSSAPLTFEDFEDLRLLIGPEVSRQEQKLRWQIGASGEALSTFASAPIRQILLNLLLNASAAAGAKGEVSLLVSEKPGVLCLIVEDSGDGLSDAARTRLLSDAPVPPGGGVGLRLVHDLVKELNGCIRSERADHITIVDVTVPLQQSGMPPPC